MSNLRSSKTQLKVCCIKDEIEYTEKQIKVARAVGERRWIVTFKDNTKYEVYGPFTNVLDMCNLINQNPISVVSKRHQPIILQGKEDTNPG